MPYVPRADRTAAESLSLKLRNLNVPPLLAFEAFGLVGLGVLKLVVASVSACLFEHIDDRALIQVQPARRIVGALVRRPFLGVALATTDGLGAFKGV